MMPGNSQLTARSGRPTKYSPGLVTAIATTMADAGMTFSWSCGYFDLSRVTVWRWGRRHPVVQRVLSKASEVRNLERQRARTDFCNRPKCPGTVTRRGLPRLRKFRPDMLILVRPTLRETAAAIGVHRNTAWLWYRRNEGFREALRRERFNRDAQRFLERHRAWFERWCA